MSKTSQDSKKALRQAKSGAEDRKLIAACISCAVAFTVADSAGKADPSGNLDHAERIIDAAYERGMRGLGQIAQIPAATMAGLSSKARLMPMVADDIVNMSATDEQIAYFQSLAADVVRLEKGGVA